MPLTSSSAFRSGYDISVEAADPQALRAPACTCLISTRRARGLRFVRYKVDVTRGERVGRVSSEWCSRPADERFLFLSALFASVNGRSEQSRTLTVESAALRVEASRDDAERLALVLPGSETPVALTHWSSGSSPRRWARGPPTYASYRCPWPGSICNMG